LVDGGGWISIKESRKSKAGRSPAKRLKADT
jgi:hypothetical protein